MLQIVFIALTLRLFTVHSACGHVYYYPLDMCINNGDSYHEMSWRIECALGTGDTPSTYDVLFYNNNDCEGNHNESRSMFFDDTDNMCQGTNACVCDSTEDCDIFEFTRSVSCSFEDSGGSHHSPLPGGDDGTYESTSTTAVVLNTCIGWPNGENGTDYYHYKWGCNLDYDVDAEVDPDSIEDRLPVVLKYYADDACEVETEEHRYYDNNYDSREGNGTYDSYSCDSTQTTDCEWKLPTDTSACSHFYHYPIDECGHEFWDRWNSWGGYVDSYESTGGYRRRLSYGSSSKYGCSKDSQGVVTYTQYGYNTNDCSGDPNQEDDVTASCTDDTCTCNAPVGGTGTSDGCVIASEQSSYWCGGQEEDISISLYATNVCIDSTSYACFPDNDYIWDREYNDTECVMPTWSQCWNTESITCNVNGFLQDTSGCGYVSDSSSVFAMDKCYGRTEESTYGITNTGEKYTCDAATGTFNRSHYNTSDCSGDPNYIEDYTWSCGDDGWYDCVCGDGALCDLTERVKIEECDGEYASAITTTEYLSMDSCVEDYNTGFYQGYTCSNDELSEIIYNDANCTDIRTECIESDGGYQYDDSGNSRECVLPTNPDGECGYYEDYPLGVCASGQSSPSYSYSYKYYCDANGQFWRQSYEDVECQTAKTGEWDLEEVTDYCYDDSCLCVVDSDCSYHTYSDTDLCRDSVYFQTNVAGVCKNREMKTCTEDGHYEYTHYEDDECTVEETYSYAYTNSEDSFHSDQCDWGISWEVSECGDEFEYSTNDDDDAGGDNNQGGTPTTTDDEDGDDDGVHTGSSAADWCRFYSIFVIFVTASAALFHSN
eukprot:404350_1